MPDETQPTLFPRLYPAWRDHHPGAPPPEDFTVRRFIRMLTWLPPDARRRLCNDPDWRTAQQILWWLAGADFHVEAGVSQLLALARGEHDGIVPTERRVSLLDQLEREGGADHSPAAEARR